MEHLIIGMIYISWTDSNKVTMGMLVFEGDNGKKQSQQFTTFISGCNINILGNNSAAKNRSHW